MTNTSPSSAMDHWTFTNRSVSPLGVLRVATTVIRCPCVQLVPRVATTVIRCPFARLVPRVVAPVIRGCIGNALPLFSAGTPTGCNGNTQLLCSAVNADKVRISAWSFIYSEERAMCSRRSIGVLPQSR